MVFSSTVFLLFFLPAVFALHWLSPSIAVKNTLLLLASLFFYAWGEPVYVCLLLLSVAVNYLFGLWAGKSLRKPKGIRRNAPVVTAVLFNLSLLAVFKYADFFLSGINTAFHTGLSLPGLLLPAGISFYTFQALSYVIDVWRGTQKANKNLCSLALYITFFPQLIAGPIIKYHEVAEQFAARTADVERLAAGVRRFLIGLSKKMLLANRLAKTADLVFAMEPERLNAPLAWLGAVAYLFQIYYDFSGYSDMAIGLGAMFGFSFPENFRYPYAACSIQDFWRRWHISLGTWFKEYLYIPLGGNRKGKVRELLHTMVVFLATGLWHGANWTFLFWGLWHGTLLCAEKAAKRKLRGVTGRIYTLLAVCIGFVMFRADTVLQGLLVIKAMFAGFFWNTELTALIREQCTPLTGLVFAAALFCAVPGRRKHKGALLETAGYAGTLLLYVLCLMELATGAYNPFIYFRF